MALNDGGDQIILLDHDFDSLAQRNNGRIFKSHAYIGMLSDVRSEVNCTVRATSRRTPRDDTGTI